MSNETQDNDIGEVIGNKPMPIYRQDTENDFKPILKRIRRVYAKDKTRNLNFRVSNHDLQSWKETAKARGMNLTQWITNVCMQEVEDEKIRSSRQGR